MGVDALDLTFRLEKRFGIKIPLRECYAVLFSTAGGIHRYLVAKLHGELRQVPDVEPLLKKMALAVDLIAGRQWFSTTADLNVRFSAANRAANWKSLQEQLGIPLPTLEKSPREEFPTVPRQCNSICALTYWIVEHCPEHVAWLPVACESTAGATPCRWTDDEIWEILRECICDALGVKPDEVIPEVRMVEDLGMD